MKTIEEQFKDFGVVPVVVLEKKKMPFLWQKPWFLVGFPAQK